MILRIFRSVNPVGGGTRRLLASAAPRSPRLSFECFIKFCQGSLVLCDVINVTVVTLNN